MVLRGELCVAWGSSVPLPGFTSRVLIATVTSSSPGELAENICLPYPVFSRCPFWWCHDGMRIDPRKYSVSSLLPPPTACYSQSVSTALPLRAYHSDALSQAGGDVCSNTHPVTVKSSLGWEGGGELWFMGECIRAETC